jgi:hypothetical protein
MFRHLRIRSNKSTVCIPEGDILNVETGRDSDEFNLVRSEVLTPVVMVVC